MEMRSVKRCCRRVSLISCGNELMRASCMARSEVAWRLRRTFRAVPSASEGSLLVVGESSLVMAEWYHASNSSRGVMVLWSFGGVALSRYT